jgi:hypothetical protein
VITALVVSLGVAMVNAFATGSRTLPVQGARAASDARVEAMIGELRNAVAINKISATQVTAAVNTAGNAATATMVNGTATGQYAVSYAF